MQIRKKYNSTNVKVLNIDSINSAHNLLGQGFCPVILNMADNCFPGGDGGLKKNRYSEDQIISKYTKCSILTWS
jgi:hypothetical protein